MSPTLPVISIIVPVFNAIDYVGSALARLTEQRPREFEIIIVDDSSTDGTADAVRQIALSEPLIRLLELPENGGVARARNFALDHARGDFVWFLDIDDDWDPSFLSRMLEAATTSGADLVVCSAVHRFGAGHGSEEYVVRYSREETLRGLDALACVLLGSGALWNKLFRREVLGHSPFPSLRSKSDHGGVLSVIPSIRVIAVVPDTLYTYVQRDGSISNGGVAQPQNFLALLQIADESLARFESTRQLRRIRARFRSMIIARALRESWRFAPESSPFSAQLADMLVWRHLATTAFTDRRTFVTCAAAKISPALARRVFRYIGRARWTPQGAN